MQPPSGCRDHDQARLLRTEEGAKRVRLEVVADVGRGHLFQRLALPGRRTVHQHVEPAEAGQGLVRPESGRPSRR